MRQWWWDLTALAVLGRAAAEATAGEERRQGNAGTFRRGDEVPLQERQAVMRQVREMHAHAFGSYMEHAFPDDELRPLSCDGRRLRERGDLDAVLGNYSMTLIDALDSLVIFDRLDDFKHAVEHISEKVNFDRDVEVSTFEVNIRILGGLLSGHLHATQVLHSYGGSLLTKAVDLAQRLRPAFDTPTGMPVSRINLQTGTPEQVSSTVTIAEAGSFLLEFGVVSLLTGDASFYNVARESVLAFWRRRSSLGLVGTAADVRSGDFSDSQSTTGPGQDSFYEYLLKSYILFDDLELLEVFYTTYAAVEHYHSFEGFTYTVDMFKGSMSNTNLSPLAAVWGSLQVLAGDVSGGLRTVLYWYSLWAKHEALPEVYDARAQAPTSARDSPLRPELVEALFYLSLALPGDPLIFKIARSIVAALDSQSRVGCGFAALADVTTKRLDDRMDSFFLSETLVYLHLTVVPAEELSKVLHWPLASLVFSTEGHAFPVPHPGVPYVVTRMPGMVEHSGRVYPLAASRRPLLTCEEPSPFERLAVQRRCRTKYLLTAGYQLQALSRVPRRCRPQEATVQIRTGSRHDAEWEPGPCMELQGVVASFGPSLPALPEGPSWAGGAAKAGCSPGAYNKTSPACRGDTGGPLHLAPQQDELGLLRLDLDQSPGQVPPFTFARARNAPWQEFFATRKVVVANPMTACSTLVLEDGSVDEIGHYAGKIVIVSRGSCLFVQKLQFLQRLDAAGAIVVDAEGQGSELQVMTCPLQERGMGRDVHIPSVMVSRADGAALLELLRYQGSEGGSVAACMFTSH